MKNILPAIKWKSQEDKKASDMELFIYGVSLMRVTEKGLEHVVMKDVLRTEIDEGKIFSRSYDQPEDVYGVSPVEILGRKKLEEL